ncbi:BppU family phage baseplate upper protein [Enterococcus durans]|uniref:BppU family phage baseplate upper protein n=2 Tax=Enterococcus durans TaxID=53345 RepID=UPI0022E85E4C|nr:BppU family phage baseplate upper protein [Enterococcus durans]
MPIRKEKKIKVVPTTTGRREGGDNHLFYSYDDSSARFVFEFKNPDDTALDLLNATPQALLILHEESGDKKVVMEELGTISVIDGLVSFVIPDNVLGFRGKCDLYIALAFADGSSSDEVHVAFTIEESPFNKTYEEAADYYIKSFDVLLKEVELAKTNAINEINEQLPQVQSRLENVENGLRVAEGELEELLDGMNLQTMYSNSIDFGNYDYSGNPNIAPNVGFNDFYNNGSQTGYTVKDGGDHIAVTRTADAPPAGKLLNLRTLLPNKTYTLSVDIWANRELPSGAISCGIQLKEGTQVRNVWALIGKPVSTNRTTYSVTFTTADNFVTTEESRITFWFSNSAGACTGYLGYNIKIEEDSTATPYQPNLLDAPYYLSKVALGENIVNPTVKFPINVNTYKVYEGAMLESFKVGETYTVTIKGRKPAQKTFSVYNGGVVFLGHLTPVEGLSDVWTGTFKVSLINSAYPNILQIYQTINDNQNGAVQIDWLKIEKGDTRTPNIEQYKYRGIGTRDSNNPKDYVWDLAPEYVEDNLATDVKISEITDKANKYTDKAIAAVNTSVVNTADDLAKQINSNKTAAESYADTKKTEAVNDSKKYTDEAITNITPNRTSLRIESGFSDGFTGWVTFERIGDIVIVSYALSPSTNTGTWKTPLPIASIPEEFRFNSNAYSTGSIATSNISNDICQVGMNGQGLQFASWNRTAGIAQFAGQLTGAVKSREK